MSEKILKLAACTYVAFPKIFFLCFAFYFIYIINKAQSSKPFICLESCFCLGYWTWLTPPSVLPLSGTFPHSALWVKRWAESWQGNWEASGRPSAWPALDQNHDGCWWLMQKNWNSYPCLGNHPSLQYTSKMLSRQWVADVLKWKTIYCSIWTSKTQCQKNCRRRFKEPTERPWERFISSA